MAQGKRRKEGLPSPAVAMGIADMAMALALIATLSCFSQVSANTKRINLPIPLERNALRNKDAGTVPTDTRVRRSPRGLFSPRLEYDEWTPLGRGDPLKNDPTYDYVPPVLERVHYWMDPSSRTPDVPQPTLASALPPTPPSAPTTPASAPDHLRPQNAQPPAHPTTVVVYPANGKHSTTPGAAVADARLDAHPFLTFVDGPKFTPKQPPQAPPTLPPYRRVSHYGEFRPLSTHQPHKHHGPSPPPPRHPAPGQHPYRMSQPYYTPTRHTHHHSSHLQIGQLEEGEFDLSTAPGQLPTPLQMLVPPPLPGNEPPVPFVQHNLLLQEQTRTTSGQTLTPPEMQKPSPATVPDPKTTPVYPVFTAPTTHPPRVVIPTHPPTEPPTTEATTQEPELEALTTLEVKEPEQFMVPPPNDPESPVPDFSGATVEIQESVDLSTSTIPSSTGTDKWTGGTQSIQFDQPSTPLFPQTSQSTQQSISTTFETEPPTTTTPILYVTFPPSTTTQAPATTTPPTPPTSTTPSLTTDPLFSHYKQPSAPLRGPMYLIIEGHSKVKTYGAGKNSIHGIPIVGSGEKEAVDDRSKGGPRRRAGSGRSLWAEEDPASIGILPPPETDPSENDVLREEWVAASRKKHGVFVVPPWGTPRRHEGGEMPIGPRAMTQQEDDDSED
ncbi:mucin-1 [Ischnura elegans]|uniref:mucin-1 n=1 Tax=Ischnura elegans TaxID=197161 RepID=UPI001ED8B643|nr:mucin-1 [Ischnura elegans]